MTTFLLSAILLFFTPGALSFAPSASSFVCNGNVNGRQHKIKSPNTRSVPSSLSASLEALLFDCDGVLADTERDGHRISFNIAFKNSGINEEWSEERYGKLLETGGGKERMTAHWNEVGWPEQIPEEGRADKILGLHLAKTDIFMKLIDEGKIPLRPGVLRLVDEAIANNVRLAVCSTSNEKAVSNLVSTLMGSDRASKFQIFAGDMVKKKKPAPDVYLMAVNEMGLDKNRCVIVEDSHIGVGAAVAADISCLVTKSSYTAGEDFTGAKIIVKELGDDANTGVTIETLTGLLVDNTSSSSTAPAPTKRGIGVQMENHIEKGGASWSGARFGDESVNKPTAYTASETYEASSTRGIGVKMEGHIEKGGASWSGARFGDESVNKPTTYTASETYEASSQRGIGVKMESHIEKGGASWTGARLGDELSLDIPRTYTASETYEASSPRGIGVDMENHIEKGGASWTGGRFGDDNSARCSPTPSQWHE